MSTLILVIDDDVTARSSMAGVLQDAGYEVDEAADGEAGLAKALEQHPALIVTDNLMPITNGTEMLERLRKDEKWGANVPVVLLTSQYSLEAMNISLSGGNTDFLIKDEATLDDVLAVIQRRLAA